MNHGNWFAGQYFSAKCHEIAEADGKVNGVGGPTATSAQTDNSQTQRACIHCADESIPCRQYRHHHRRHFEIIVRVRDQVGGAAQSGHHAFKYFRGVTSIENAC